MILSSRKYDSKCSSRIGFGYWFFGYPGSRIQPPGVEKAPDPGSGSATLEDKTVGSPTALMSPVLPPWIAALGTDRAYGGWPPPAWKYKYLFFHNDDRSCNSLSHVKGTVSRMDSKWLIFLLYYVSLMKAGRKQNQCFRSGFGLESESIGSLDLDPNPGSQKWPTKKRKRSINFMFYS